MADAVIRVQYAEAADRQVALPIYATEEAAGADVRANFPDRRQVTIAPGARALIPTGLMMQIAPGYEVQVRPRSGLALKHGVTVLNTPGTIDSDYRGEIGVILINLGEEEFVVAHGDRVAQLVVAPVTQARFMPSDSLEETARGAGGFGSTGQS